MDNNLLVIIYYITLALVSVNALLVIIGKPGLTKWFGYLALIFAGTSIVITCLVSGHPPIYNKFTTVQQIVFIVLLLGIIHNRTPKDKQKNINLFWYAALILLSFILTREMIPGNNYYMYDNPFVILFFQFRLISVGIFVFAACNYLTTIIKDFDKDYTEFVFHRARNYTIVGAVVYLAGEFCGSYWLYLWDGESWHWSKGFFLASVMFLLSMLGSHIPAKYMANRKLRPIISFAPLLAIILIYLI